MTIYENSFLDEGKKKSKNRSKKTDYSVPQSKFKTIHDILKFHKKRLKGQGSFVTYDVGNMEYNNALFNKMMGSGDAITSSGTSADGAVSFSSGAAPSSAASGGGMGESFSIKTDNQQTLTEARELRARPEVQKFIENNIKLLETDPEGFIVNALNNARAYRDILDMVDISNLFRILHAVGIDVTPSIFSKLNNGCDYLYIDYETTGADDDYLRILEDLVSVVPNRYIDRKWWEGKTAKQVIDAIKDSLKYSIESITPPEDMDSDVLGVRVECFVLGNGFAQSDRGIGVLIIVETHNDIGVIELDSFGNIFLDSLGYMLSKNYANEWLDDYKRDIEIGLKHIRK